MNVEMVAMHMLSSHCQNENVLYLYMLATYESSKEQLECRLCVSRRRCFLKGRIWPIYCKIVVLHIVTDATVNKYFDWAKNDCATWFNNNHSFTLICCHIKYRQNYEWWTVQFQYNYIFLYTPKVIQVQSFSTLTQTFLYMHSILWCPFLHWKLLEWPLFKKNKKSKIKQEYRGARKLNKCCR